MAETSIRSATIDDLLDLKELDDVQLSPDGTLALFTVGLRGGERDRAAPMAIMAAPTNGDEPWQFSAGVGVDSQPRWSPDGRDVAFLSDRPHGLSPESRPGATQVYVQRRGGGEARRVSAISGEIQRLSWSPDGVHFTALIRDPEPVADPERGEAINIEAVPRFCRLWSLDPVTGTARALTPSNLQLWDYDLTSDGASALVLASDLPDESSWYRAR